VALAVGAVAASFASVLYNTGLLLQAEASRREPVSVMFAPGLLVRLVQRRRWLAGSAIAVLGWPVHAFALTRAPLTVVQPLLALGLIVPLAFGKRMLGEHVQWRDVLNIGVLVAGGSLLVAFAPPRSNLTGASVQVAIALAVLATVLLCAMLLAAFVRHRRGLLLMLAAGVGFALSSLTTKLLADAFSRREWVALAIWLAVTAAAGGVALIGEMNALQVSAASTVAALVLALETIVPVTLAPFLFGEAVGGSAPSELLRSAAFAMTIGAAIVLTRARSVVEARAEA
jgi:drug/metabolite transporter (DMT)-like permease